MMKRVLFIALCWLGAAAAFSQENLRPLGGRINCLEQELKARPDNHSISARTQSTTLLQIPFLDDFHYAPLTVYADMNLWMDSSAYVNWGYPIAPPSIGVATFDGLDKHGYPYTPGVQDFNASNPADTLTSRPIDLHMIAATTQPILKSDSIGLSFYYQARGNGETPEEIDSLLLDFYKPHQKKWINVWGIEGNGSDNINDTNFYRALVWIADSDTNQVGDTAYLAEGFQFRFRNKATTNGDFDHWHIDYVYLDQHRSVFDTVLNDLTIETIPSSYLKNYSAMPFKHFIPSEMAQRVAVRIRNNSLIPVNMIYDNRAFTYPGHVALQSFTYTGGSNIMHSYYPNTQDPAPANPGGLSTYINHAYAPITYTFAAPITDFTQFDIQHYVYRSQNASSDFILGNDTVTERIDFSNYFALDDGSAEAGYYILGQSARMGMRIQLNVPDTLEGVRIYFDPVGYGYSLADTISYRFSINVWDGSGAEGAPGNLIYTDPYTRHAQYGTYDFKTALLFKLSAPLALNSGVYYVGIQQKNATGISIGFDVNQDHHENFYYDSGGGWTQSGFHGSPMIRPVLGAASTPVGIKENRQDQHSFLIYPNPSSGQFIIASNRFENTVYQLMNSLGQTLQEAPILQREQLVNTGSLADGIYFLAIKSGSRLLQQQKIIIQH